MVVVLFFVIVDGGMAVRSGDVGSGGKLRDGVPLFERLELSRIGSHGCGKERADGAGPQEVGKTFRRAV